VLDSEAVRLEMNDASRPVVVREGSDYMYVLMPVTGKG
jgi:DNA polymerase III sliding clamp (beta) subunit (PCNA family)